MAVKSCFELTTDFPFSLSRTSTPSVFKDFIFGFCNLVVA